MTNQDEIPDEIKQKIASEIGFSETAFVSKKWVSTGQGSEISGSADRNSTLELDVRTNSLTFKLRWFTLETEVALCGHATLAAARAMFKLLHADEELDTIKMLNFVTKKSGTLTSKLDPESGLISLDFPSNPTTRMPYSQTLENLLCASVGENHAQIVERIEYSPTLPYLLVQLKNSCSNPEVAIKKLSPNCGRLVVDGRTILQTASNESVDPIVGIILTIASSEASESADFYSRFFAPFVGVNEDPVCGSAHTMLMPFWYKFHPTKAGSRTLIGKQCSERGGMIHCTLDGDRVLLSGSTAVIVGGEIDV